MAYDGVTAISWGPWRAEFLGETDDGLHRIGIWPHDVPRKDREAMLLAETVVADRTEAGLREALAHYAKAQGTEDEQKLHDADPRWADRVAEANAVKPARTVKRAAKKAKKR